MEAASDENGEGEADAERGEPGQDVSARDLDICVIESPFKDVIVALTLETLSLRGKKPLL